MSWNGCELTIGDVDGSLRDTELIQSPCRSERGPQPGEPGPENENA